STSIVIAVKSSRGSVLLGDELLSTFAITTRVIGSTDQPISKVHRGSGSGAEVHRSLKTPLAPSASTSQGPLVSLVCMKVPKLPASVTSQYTADVDIASGCIQ